MLGMGSGMPTLPIVTLGYARVYPARQETIWTRA